MTIDRAVMAFAGSVILVSLALAETMSPLWLLLTAFAGLNLVQASFTGFCPAAMVFKRLDRRHPASDGADRLMSALHRRGNFDLPA